MKPPRYYKVDPKDIKPGDEFSGYDYKPERGTAFCLCTVIVNEEGTPLIWGKNPIKEEVLFFHRDLTWEEQNDWFRVNIDINKDVNKLNLIGFHNDLYHIGDASHEMWNGWITACGWEEQLMTLDGEDFFVVGVAPAPFSPNYFDNPVAIVIEGWDTGNRRWCHCEKDWIDNFRKETKQFV